MKPTSKPVLIHLTAADPEAAAKRYGKFFGVEFARSLTQDLSFHAPVTSDGTFIIISKQYRGKDGITVYFSVDDLDAATKEFTGNGASISIKKSELKVERRLDEFRQYVANSRGIDLALIGDSLGSFCEIEDPDGNRFGLVQFNDFANSFYGTGPQTRDLSIQQIQDHQQALQLGN